MLYFVRYTFPFTGVIRIPAGGQEPRGGSIIVEADDDEAAKDQAMFEIYKRATDGHSLNPIIPPRIVEVSEYID